MVPSHWVLAAQPRTQSAGQKAGFVNESYVLCYLTEPSEALMMPTKAHFFFTEAGPQKHTEWFDTQGNKKKVQVAEKWVAA